MNLAPGTIFAGDYRIERPLSQGGMGAVYVVSQVSTGKLRALKLMHGSLVHDPASRQRFELEARVGSRIASEHVVEVQAAGVDPQTGVPYLVMELLEGESLASRLSRGAMPPSEALAVLEQVAHALGAAHDAGVVHRDLKPDNIFLAVSRRMGSSLLVKILDFGIAKVTEHQRSTTAAFGTPLWLAPEQTRRGEITPAADVWALGLLAFAMLTGHTFWRAPDAPNSSIVTLMSEITTDAIPPASSRAAERAARVPDGFDAWFARALARDPAARFPNARVAFAALAPILREPEAPLLVAKPKSGAGAIVALVLAFGVLIAGATVAAFWFLRRETASAPPPGPITTSAPPPSVAAAPPPSETAPPPPPSATAKPAIHVSPFISGGDDSVREDIDKQMNLGLGQKLDDCFVTHPGGAPHGNAVVQIRVAADGHVTSAQMLLSTNPEPAVQCMIDTLKGAKFASSKRGTAISFVLGWNS